MPLDLNRIPSPCYVCEQEKLEKNLSVLDRVQQEAGCKILLALKGFAMFSVFPLVKKVLKGTCASSLNEARLGREEFGGEVHIFAPAYRDDEFGEILNIADHVVFNSFSQWEKFRARVKEGPRKIECGLRVNPEYSEVRTEAYNPCARYSRLGTTRKEFMLERFHDLEGLHFHSLCENNADALERTLLVVGTHFREALGRVRWVNFGGGHHITRGDYDVELLISLVREFKKKFGVEIYLEPGEAVALNAGVLVATVLDVMRNEKDIAILDASASTHMPDVLEMPYRPSIVGASTPGAFPHTYRLAGNTCLAGDIIGDYSFPEPLKPGAKLVFEDMLHYSMVKNNTFNGINLPSIGIWSEQEGFRLVRKFGYEDYRMRLS